MLLALIWRDGPGILVAFARRAPKAAGLLYGRQRHRSAHLCEHHAAVGWPSRCWRALTFPARTPPTRIDPLVALRVE